VAATGEVKTKLINDGPQKTYVLVLDKGDEPVSSIEGFASENGIAAAQLTGIGACSDRVLGFFDWETNDYRKIPVTDQVEVVSLLGDIGIEDLGASAMLSGRRNGAAPVSDQAATRAEERARL
jgi:predicted DNA-binding protein with PD1-like motif